MTADPLLAPPPATTSALDRALADLRGPAATERIAADLADLIRVPGITGSAAESALQHQLAERLTGVGAAVDRWRLDLAALAADPAFPGIEAPRDEAWGVVGEFTGHGPGPTLVLNAHVDVVPPGSDADWSTPAFVPRRDAAPDGRDAMFGRGACDMKGGLVSVLAAVTALRASGMRWRGRVVVQCVVGEEDGGLGTFATLARGHRGDLAVVPEPTSGTVVCANAGALTFRLTVRGRAVHASSRADGVSAIERFWPVFAALRRLEAGRHVVVDPLMAHLTLPYALELGTVHAGDWGSSVPDRLVAEGRLGVALDESPAHARAALVEAVAAACAQDPWLAGHPAIVEFVGGQFASGRTPVDSPVVTAVAAAHRAETGAVPALRGAPYGSDLRLLVGAGVPTVHYGPGSVRHAHAPDEHVPLDEVLGCARTLVRLIDSVCGEEAGSGARP